MRPAPEILFQTNPRGTRYEQVLKSESVYAVCYEGKPVNLRAGNQANYISETGIEYPGRKYKKTTFVNPAHAYNLATRLNKICRTNGFKVHLMIVGEVVEE